VFEVVEILAVDHGPDPVSQFGNDPIHWRHNGDVGKPKPFADRGAILLISTDTAHRLGDNDFEYSGFRGSEQSMYAISVEH
jgi:hypothetical protein